MSIPYLIWEEEFSPDNADFKKAQSIYDVYFNLGVDISSEMPDEPIELLQEPGTGRNLPDFIQTVFAMLVNNSLRSTLIEFGVDNIQYYPVVLKNTKNKVMSEDYSIANVVGMLDCIDIDQSEYEIDPFRKRYYCTMSRIVLDPKRMENGPKLYRLDRYTDILMIRSDLAEAIEAKHSGMNFITLEEYNLQHKKEW
jgi:hypothetical protein